VEIFLIMVLASFVDPIRWLVCVLAGWFVPNYIGAMAVGVGSTVLLSVMLVSSAQGPALLAGAVSSAAIVSIFYFWRQNRRNKAASAVP